MLNQKSLFFSSSEVVLKKEDRSVQYTAVQNYLFSSSPVFCSKYEISLDMY